MTKGQQKDIATSMTILVFLIVGTTGVLMFFHIFDAYTKEMHEILGLVFVAAAVLHVLVHMKGFKQYFTKKVFAGFFVIFFAIALGFIFSVEEGVSPKKIAFDKLFENPIEKTFVLFTDNVDTAKQKLLDSGIKVENEKTILEIAKSNGKNPFEIISIISK